ncbi:MAG: hypothetical protein BWX51_01048 [Bacteroidetes bacterium ADurb.Bin012]|jgi:hypothetical protein|nr:MAG: hypothetical protein BWX51_01048 [Bacteroidetes bacterium ADurb.Bin012]
MMNYYENVASFSCILASQFSVHLVYWYPVSHSIFLSYFFRFYLSIYYYHFSRNSEAVTFTTDLFENDSDAVVNAKAKQS